MSGGLNPLPNPQLIRPCVPSNMIFLKFHSFSVEKIKTIGATYMVAAGLTPKAVYDGTDTDLDIYLSNLCEFAFAMQDCIKRINKHSFNNFQLRIGWSCCISS